MAKKGANVESLTIFLIKKDIIDYNRILQNYDKLVVQEITLLHNKSGRLFFRKSRTVPPRWVERLFKDYIEEIDIRIASVSAVFLTKSHGSIFALTFGQGRHLLEADVYEENFGFRVTLNSIDPNKIRTIDKETFETNPLRSRAQISQASTIAEFGLNVDHDIVRAVSGAPKDKALGTLMAGRDALSVRVPVDLSNLDNLLGKYLKIGYETTYRTKFQWIDNIYEVKNASKINALNDVLIQRLSENENKDIWLAIPTIIDWDDFGGFKYFSKDADNKYDDITLDEFIRSRVHDKKHTIESLKKERVYWLDASETFVKDKWSIYRCANMEITESDGTYILTSGV